MTSIVKKGYPKNDVFFIKKRQLMRKADQLKKYCECEVFLAVHKKDIEEDGKMFAYQTCKTFDLE